MAKQVVRNAAIWLDAYDLQVGANRVDINGTAAAVDATCFADTSRSKLLDTPEAAISAAGYTEDSFAKALYDLWGDENLAFTTALTKTVGARAFVASVQNGNFNVGAQRGNVAQFTLACAVGPGGFGQGVLLHVGNGIAATGTGAIQTLRGISANMRAVASLHVTSVGGTTPSVTARVESAPTVAFAAPVTRATFTAVTAVPGSGQTQLILGPVTDIYWRAAWTISGTSPLFNLSIALGFEEGL
jgi:hypothetical protein